TSAPSATPWTATTRTFARPSPGCRHHQTAPSRTPAGPWRGPRRSAPQVTTPVGCEWALARFSSDRTGQASVGRQRGPGEVFVGPHRHVSAGHELALAEPCWARRRCRPGPGRTRAALATFSSDCIGTSLPPFGRTRAGFGGTLSGSSGDVCHRLGRDT